MARSDDWYAAWFYRVPKPFAGFFSSWPTVSHFMPNLRGTNRASARRIPGFRASHPQTGGNVLMLSGATSAHTDWIRESRRGTGSFAAARTRQHISASRPTRFSDFAIADNSGFRPVGHQNEQNRPYNRREFRRFCKGRVVQCA